MWVEELGLLFLLLTCLKFRVAILLHYQLINCYISEGVCKWSYFCRWATLRNGSLSSFPCSVLLQFHSKLDDDLISWICFSGAQFNAASRKCTRYCIGKVIKINSPLYKRYCWLYHSFRFSYQFDLFTGIVFFKYWSGCIVQFSLLKKLRFLSRISRYIRDGGLYIHYSKCLYSCLGLGVPLKCIACCLFERYNRVFCLNHLKGWGVVWIFISEGFFLFYLLFVVEVGCILVRLRSKFEHLVWK